MGFLKHLLFWPVTGPMYLADFSLRHVQGVVREELTDDERIKEELLDLQLRLELEEVDEEEYVREEARLMEALRDVRRWREEFGMGTRGGVVQVGDAGRDAGSASVDREARADVSLDWESDEPEERDAPAPADQDAPAPTDQEDPWSPDSSGDSGPASSSS